MILWQVYINLITKWSLNTLAILIH